MTQLYLWTKIRTKQWLVLGASAFQCMRAGFLCAKCGNFACLHTRKDQNELHLKRWFFAKIVKSNVAIFPSVVQAYTQPYSFGGRIKLIICQIRHELSVTIHEISPSWKNNARWRTLIFFFCCWYTIHCCCYCILISVMRLHSFFLATWSHVSSC